MNNITFQKTLRALVLTGAAVVTSVVWADTPSNPYGQGYGPGYGMGPGMMGGYGPGYGMGPGMMGGYGQGYGMGPGMMGGYGQGYGMGPGMMGGYGQGYGPGYGIDLSAEQRSKIGKIQDDLRRKHWDLMGKMQDEQSRMIEQYNAEKRDDAALNASNKKIAGLQQQMFELSLSAQKQMDEVLTKEQRDTLRRGAR